jgi:hypothetical protein
MIAVIGHGSFLHYFTNDWTGIGDDEHGKCQRYIHKFRLVYCYVEGIAKSRDFFLQRALGRIAIFVVIVSQTTRRMQ